MTYLQSVRRVVAVVALASSGLVAGCAYAPPIGDSKAAAAGAVESSGTTIDDETSSTTSSTMTPLSLTLPDVLAQERFTALSVALERSGLDAVIAELDSFVMFAPTDTAFSSAETDVGIGYFPMLNNAQLLDAVLRYHIVATPDTTGSWRTLNGATIAVQGSDPETIRYVNGVEVLERIQVRGGIVLVMPRVLLPSQQQTAGGPVSLSGD